MTDLVQHDEQTEGRAFVAGDIHGQYDALMDALRRVNFDTKRDVLYQAGDLIDRGADSFDCLALAFEPWFRGVWGNHEQMALDALRSGGDHAWNTWFANGGSWVHLESAPEVSTLLQEVARHLPLAREITVRGRTLGLVHAEPPWDWQQVVGYTHHYKESLIWGRDRISRNDVSHIEGIDAVIAGHSIVQRPTWLGNMLYIDTGACTPTGSLTLLALDDVVDEIEQREAAEAATYGA